MSKIKVLHEQGENSLLLRLRHDKQRPQNINQQVTSIHFINCQEHHHTITAINKVYWILGLWLQEGLKGAEEAYLCIVDSFVWVSAFAVGADDFNVAGEL